jgi:hypothetical protein
MSDDAASYPTRRWSKYFDEIDTQIAQLSLMCDIKILDPGVIERVLSNDSSVCGKHKPDTFAKLRGLLMMHYSSREKAMVSLGQEEAIKVVHDTVARLRERMGGRLGGPGS